MDLVHGDLSPAIPMKSGAMAAVTRIVAFTAATLVAIEIGILFCGVFARYALHNPIGWVDELASILFLWLAMFGAVIALDRSEHMRMTAALGRCSAKTRTIMGTLAIAAPAVFLAIILPSAIEYSHEQHVILTPALSLPNSLRVAAIPTGVVLMLLVAMDQLRRIPHALAAVAGTATALALIYAATPHSPGLAT